MTMPFVQALTIRATLTVGAMIAALLGVVALGDLSQEQLKGHPRYRVAIQSIDCDVPPGQERSQFLEAVHYYGQLPEQVNLLDHDLPAKLRAAFQQHPQVADVRSVERIAPDRIRVALIFRP